MQGRKKDVRGDSCLSLVDVVQRKSDGRDLASLFKPHHWVVKLSSITELTCDIHTRLRGLRYSFQYPLYGALISDLRARKSQ